MSSSLVSIKMSISLLHSMLHRVFVFPRWPLFLYAATWTALLTATVTVASFSPEFAFVSAITPSYSFSRMCNSEGSVRVPLDVPTEVFCFPAQVFRRSKMDLLVPPVFAAMIVAGSAYVVSALGLWEVDNETH